MVEDQETIIGAIRGGMIGLGAYMANLDYELFIIWVSLACLDVVLGVLNSMVRHSFKSSIMSSGLLNKIREFLVLLACVFAQRAAHLIGINIPAATFFIGAFIFKDIGSILETAIQGGINIPEKIKDIFAVAEKETNELLTKKKDEEEN